MKTIPDTRPSLLLTGSEGMLGAYLRRAFADFDITGMSRSAKAGCIQCDLSKETPRLPDNPFCLVIHAAGTTDADAATEINLEGTKRLLKALSAAPPQRFIFISDAAVYGLGGAENIDETANTWTTEKVGQSKILAEKEVTDWGREHGVEILILRPAPMFGSGIQGEMKRLFEDVLRHRYIHIRGNDARRGIVTAYDVARAAFALRNNTGIYNVADGRNRTLLDLVNAMSANAGEHKRPVFLPPKWAAIGAHIPGLKNILDPKILESRARTITYSCERLKTDAGFTPFDTIEVISRREKDYPYQDK